MPEIVLARIDFTRLTFGQINILFLQNIAIRRASGLIQDASWALRAEIVGAFPVPLVARTWMRTWLKKGQEPKPAHLLREK